MTVGLDAPGEQQHLKGMPKKKDPPLSAAEQRKRFEETARRLGASLPRDKLKELVHKVAKPTKRPPLK